MRYLEEPTYKHLISGKIKRFDDRKTGFSRGVIEGNKYRQMHEKGMYNIEHAIEGKTILEHALWVAGRTVNYQLRKNVLARKGKSRKDGRYKLKNPDPNALSTIIKDAALWFGADGVGITRLNPLWLYSHWGYHSSRYIENVNAGDPIELPSEYKWVIVIIHEMAYEDIQKTPAIEPATDLAYSRISMSAASLATFINELGYNAIPAENEIALSIPLAVDAGLGELGRLGLLITREYGPRVRISKVFTDLPLIQDRPIDIGINKFCERCRLCALHCPSQALQKGSRTDSGFDESNSTGLLKWPVDAMKCYDWWITNGCHCSVCIRVCPWNKPKNILHSFVRQFAERGILVPLLLWFDTLLGYGKQKKNRFYSQVQDPRVSVKPSQNDST